jgi:hypothetical protein
MATTVVSLPNGDLRELRSDPHRILRAMRRIIGLGLAWGCAGCANTTQPSATPTDPVTVIPEDAPALADITVPPRPDWMDPYADSNEGDMRFFDIDALMSRYDLSRALAVELQNHYRDASRAQPEGSPTTWFEQALELARAQRFEDRRDLARLEQAAFVVVFDLDDTLHDQYYSPEVGAKCHDLAVPRGEDTRYMKLTPGWAEAIARVVELDGAVVLFSANVDDTTWANLEHWTLDDAPVHEHPHISGVLTNSHLVLQKKSAGTPVVEPSKDLRIIDPTLGKVILVDDNPGRVFQFRNLRTFPKFDADAYCTTRDEILRRAFDSALPAVIAEIEDAAQYMRNRDVDFATAYLPFSTLGRVAVDFMMDAGLSEPEAIGWVREHPDAVPKGF